MELLEDETDPDSGNPEHVMALRPVIGHRFGDLAPIVQMDGIAGKDHVYSAEWHAPQTLTITTEDVPPASFERRLSDGNRVSVIIKSR